MSETATAAPRLEQMLTVAEIAAAWSVSEDVVRELIAAGELPATRIGRPWRIRVSDAEAYLARNSSGGDQ